jgi:hypothetical protein
VVVTVEAEVLETIAPTAVIEGGDITVASGAEVTLDGSGSSDNTGIIDSYEWAVTPAELVELGVIDEDELTFTAPIVPYGEDDVELEVTLTVLDLAQNVGTATVTIKVLANALPEGAPTVAQTQEAIVKFMQARAGHVISAQPDLIGLLSGTKTKGGNANGSLTNTQSNGSFDYTTSGSQRVWGQVQGNWSTSGGAKNGYALGTVGGHFNLTPNAIAGLMLEVDTLTQEYDETTSTGSGYLVGPYFVAKMPDQPLYFEGRYLLGATSNSTRINGAAEQAFDTSRSLVKFKVAGQIVSNTLTLTPSLSFTHLKDVQGAFINNYGQTVPEQGIATSDATIALDFAKPMLVENGELLLTGGVAGSWSVTSNSGFASTITPDYEGQRGSLHLGTVYTSASGLTLNGDVSYDGLLVDDYQSVGVSLGLTKEF